MANENIYVGNGKIIDTKYGPMTKLNLCLDDVFSYAKTNIQKAKNGKKYISLDVVARQNADNYGNTLAVKVNTYVPDPSAPKAAPKDWPKEPSAPVVETANTVVADDEDIPF